MVEWTYSRVLELCPHVGDASDKFSALRGLWVYQFIRANLQSALNLAGELLELGEQEQHKGYLLEAHRALGQTLLYLGDFVASHAHLQQGLELYDERDHREHVQLYGNDPGVACLVYHAYVSWFLGYPDQALAQSERAVSKATELGHPFSVAYALAFATYLHQHVRDVEGTKEYAERTIALARERQFPFWQHQETILHGWALVEQGDTVTGFEELERGMDNYHKGGAALADPWFEGLLAEALSKDERETEALESLEKSIDIAKHSSEGFFVAEAHRLQGELMLKQRGLEAAIDAERCFRQSLKVAREQRARSWELRAAVSLGRLWQSTGHLADARNLVGPVFEAFTEGFATRDLMDAESLLDDLRKG
jgi:predicted ATPase